MTGHATGQGEEEVVQKEYTAFSPITIDLNTKLARDVPRINIKHLKHCKMTS